MDKQDFLNYIHNNIFFTLIENENFINTEEYKKLNEFKKTEYKLLLALKIKNQIKKKLHTYENDLFRNMKLQILYDNKSKGDK